jgi:hypothetical protein
VVVAFYFPAVVVEEQVVVFTQRDPVGDVGFAFVARPLVDVVGFSPGHGCVASDRCASAPFDGEGFALFRGEQPVFSSDIQRLKIFVENQNLDAA